jgi:hypothetical protein
LGEVVVEVVMGLDSAGSGLGDFSLLRLELVGGGQSSVGDSRSEMEALLLDFNVSPLPLSSFTTCSDDFTVGDLDLSP